MRTTLNIGLRSAATTLAFFGMFLFSGCVVDATDLDESAAEDGVVEGESIESTEQAIYSGWTAFTSEEYPPISCDSASLMSTVQCTGGYCDNIRAYCQPTRGSLGSAYWTSYFSEESTNYRLCASGYWVTGLACKGGWCDNTSLQCSYIGNITPINCYWTGWVSEENGGTLSFGTGYFARGAQCSGSNCDNRRFYVCQAG
jgi:hypothetical protein